ncbi:tetraacyldisaccharide 4'-kinase [Moraxella nasovis]|uniref:tetraacyldisaccharide 4'-kinase n=1 Tax=Moraxella nasovis TaxID=2904121 RepID=UPI001F612185|nr:tetraacyldisaccharide 4'-kinase [Moraxella nasovis]UNU73460.1 tetraacyldisaccharide 4'-kinase [Moraxella nasovis]
MKKLELIITRAWQQQSRWLNLLAPLSALYKRVSDHHKHQYKTGKKPTYHAPIPVMVIGNITVGGSGKTPLIIALVAYLQQKGVRVGVISRGYGRADDTPALVQADSTPQMVGDEPCLIVSSTNVPMAVGVNRGQAIDLLIQNHPNLQFIISDDGLQHHALHRDVEWIVVDGVRGFGNEKLLPQGFLREPLSRLDGATVIYHDPRPEQYPPDSLLMHLVPSEPVPLVGVDKILSPQTVYAVSGIGYPQRFFKTLTDLGFGVIQKPFGDHHKFGLDDLANLTEYPIVITAKDAVKVRELAKDSHHAIFDNIWILPVKAVLSKAVYDEMDRVVKNFI